jgi:hypothetical protein
MPAAWSGADDEADTVALVVAGGVVAAGGGVAGGVATAGAAAGAGVCAAAVSGFATAALSGFGTPELSGDACACAPRVRTAADTSIHTAIRMILPTALIALSPRFSRPSSSRRGDLPAAFQAAFTSSRSSTRSACP